MPEAWSRWEGQVIDGRFELKRCLTASDEGALFLTEIRPRGETPRQPGETRSRAWPGGDPAPESLGPARVADRVEDLQPQPIPLAIKLMALDPDRAARQLSRWRLAQLLSHPNLLRVFDAGRCRLGDKELIFGVMEYTDENLAEILSQRALSVDETRQLLEPALNALAYLHGQGLVHGCVKPASVLALGDQIKLASDSISPAKEMPPELFTADAYEAPEIAQGARSAASDVWSLGVVLSQALTLRLPIRNGAKSSADPRLPDSFPAPFLEIVRGCLRRDPDLRWTVAGITAWLHPETSEEPVPVTVATAVRKTVTAAERPGAQQAPAPQPASPKTAITENSLPHKPVAAIDEPAPQKAAAGDLRPAASPVTPAPVLNQTSAAAEAQERPARGEAKSKQAASSFEDFLSWTVPLLRRFAVPAIVAIVALAALYAGLGVLRHETKSPTPIDIPQTDSEQKPTVQKPQAGSTRSETKPVRSETKPSPRVNSNGSASSSRTAQRPAAVTSGPNGEGRNPGVVQQVLPQASASALKTIQGTIRVNVKVTVDAAGNPTAAELVNPGPSAYFARLSRQAAQGWRFAPGQAGQAFLLHFEFTNSGVNASATKAGG